MFLCQVTLLLAILHALSAQKFYDSQGCTANNQSTITITGTNGTIPSTLGFVPRNATCQWNITAPVGKVLRINIRASFHEPCGGDYLRIYDGPSDASDIMAEYNCNSSVVNGTIFFSSRRSLWLEVKTGINANSTAMLVSYEALEKQECSINSTLHAPQSPEEHNFSSPYYPQGYRMNMTCGWYITAPEDHIVMLQLTSPLSSSHSSKDSVEVYDVDGSELTIISQALKKIYSKSRFVYVVFKSDDKVDGISEQGIFVKYSAVKTVRSCSFDNSDDENMNIVLRNASGVFQSPWYPHRYPYELINKCHWKIIAPKGKVVRIEFLSFRICDNYAQITDRINGLNSRIVKISGKLPSFNFYSTGNELSIIVKRHFGNRGPGFIANYTSVPTVSSGTCILNESSTVHMAGEGRSFSTPGYPSHPGKGTCSWNITVSPGEFVKVTFWEMEGSSNQNYAEVYDVTNSRWKSLGTFARHSRVNEFYSIGNNVLVEFTSRYLAWPGWPGGFIASYEAVKAAPARYSCSKPTPNWWSKNVVTLHGYNGEFASFGYPLPYPNDVKCSWEIKAPLGYVIQLTFHSFHLQPTSYDCWDDYVSISELGRWRQRIGRFCGSSLPSVIQSNYSTVYVDFLTDSAGRFPGFHASYKWLRDPTMGPCKSPGGGENIIPLTGETGRLFSPLYPRNFAESISCTWVITAPEGHFVRLKIKALSLGRDCWLSSLYIRDGQNSSSDVFKKFCDDQTFQTSMFSSGRYLRVEFRSLKHYDNSYASKFDAVFETVNKVPASFSCTEGNQVIDLKSTSGSLASLNYPLPYDAYVSCTWKFSMDSDYKINLWFDFFNVSCNHDHVRVLDKRYCGSEKPPSVTLTTRDRVYFRCSGYYTYPGFKASYETKTTGVLSPLKIVGISFGALLALCVVVFVCYKCWKKNSHRVPHTAVVHSLTNDVETEQEQDTVL